MNPRNTWLWLIVAVLLFAVIYGLEKFGHKPETGPYRLLPGFNAAEVHSLQVLPKGHRPVLAERTNGVWHLAEPALPARPEPIELLLGILQHIAATRFIPPGEMAKNADQQY